IRDDLSQNSFDTLTQRRTTGVQHHFSARIDFYARIFPGTRTAFFHEASHTDADGSALTFCMLTEFFDIDIVDSSERFVQLPGEITAVEYHSSEGVRAGIIGYFMRLDQVSAAHVRRVES